MRTAALTLGSIALLLLVVSTPSAQAPPHEHGHHHTLPDKFTNLQVLPKDISKDELVDTMRLFSHSLGVHCDHCHEQAGDQMDWPSDKKDAKNAARTMLKMVHDINANYMPKTEPLPGEKSGDKVNCWTCHRGQKEPAQGPPPEEHHEGPPPGMGPNSAPPTGGAPSAPPSR